MGKKRGAWPPVYVLNAFWQSEELNITLLHRLLHPSRAQRLLAIRGIKRWRSHHSSESAACAQRLLAIRGIKQGWIIVIKIEGCAQRLLAIRGIKRWINQEQNELPGVLNAFWQSEELNIRNE